MSHSQLFQQMFGLILVVLWLVGCSKAPAGAPITPTLIPATVTPAAVLVTERPGDDTNQMGTDQPTSPMVTATEIQSTTKDPIADASSKETCQLDDNDLALQTALGIHFDVAPEEIQFSISEQTVEHTKGNVPGGYFLAAREGDAWMIVFDGQATPGCTQIATYDFPFDMVPECLDGNNNLVVREVPTKEAEARLMILGTVMNVSLSAHIITLQEPVEGVRVVALTEASELVSSDGKEITLQEIQPGMTIQASGEPGASATLLAGQVCLLP